MTNLEWAAELMPDADGWVQGCIATTLDRKDKRIAELEAENAELRYVIQERDRLDRGQ